MLIGNDLERKVSEHHVEKDAVTCVPAHRFAGRAGLATS